MHITLRRVGTRGPYSPRAWAFKWGFGVWLGRTLFTFGHDTRSRTVTAGDH